MTKDDNEKNNDEKKLSINMVVNGTPHTLEFALGQKLKGVVEKTLEKTGNVGQPPENWELKDANGTLLDLDKHLRDYDCQDGVTLFLNLKAGIGG